MPANPSQSSPNKAFDESMMDVLACPACMGQLRLEATHLACATCARTYPIVNGIPVLIADRAVSKQS